MITRTRRFLGLVSALALSLCMACSGNADSVGKPDRQTETDTSQNNPASMAYHSFTVTALEQYLKDEIYTDDPSVTDIQSLGSGTVVGNGSIIVEQADDPADTYDVEYMCKPNHASAFSVTLQKGSEQRFLVKEDGCVGNTVRSVSLPIRLFPKAESIAFSGPHDSSFVVVVHEIHRAEPTKYTPQEASTPM
ncbi:hypothetical protein [Bifidobacterium sp. ESL0704]|uniref:hypothetical protein n=1 Tax=Bifidobacterium sp. ESL0704 TaxID=2983219 RepID=UPI0023F71FD5|nr:hypothetical protein [Bifidobacterium sp. ESL0704]WEV53551.1 hypothetical protein OZX64_03550 [Bifidobacterium sp. ESL0704]